MVDSKVGYTCVCTHTDVKKVVNDAKGGNEKTVKETVVMVQLKKQFKEQL